MDIEALKAFFYDKSLIVGEKLYLRNEYLVKVDEKVKYLYWIEEGTVRAYLIDDNGEEQNIRFGYKGDLISVLSSVFMNQASDLYLQALKKTRVKIISMEYLNTLKYEDIEFSKTWMAILEKLVCQQMEREMDLLTQDPRLRYQRVMERSPQLFQEISSKHIANYLRMTAETLSRVRKS
ncbi:MAG TPA: Crp/Fnr family transcriptional regulator [Saprospiraceae bacterium]|nr:Crp/Fnr family transcriptional regulator [Saprospiraceae bacterium]